MQNHGLVEIVRIPLSEIQASAYVEHDGIPLTTFVTNQGDSFAIAAPCGSGVTCAADLVERILKLRSL